MPLLAWREALSVGDPRIDEDHKKLISFVNELNDAIEGRKSDRVVGKIILELVQYTKDHFTREEACMKGADYPDYERHKQIHQALTAQVLLMAEKYVRTPTDEVKKELIDFLAAWLVEHIIKEDRKLGSYLQGKRVWV
ncbi:hemerythrin family protein [Caenispirillum salinarum AK4]|uniref:Hemerythrin family protein n=1 Tax=Caenispirillum salinarum AK4 TaxID=1238182 RepID=K9H213_9PROT|nr:bacteriohemerythrin [Caenispirillum salinarum]EKV32315.1 hemerythrin family protein [Caenispirillum salinarum AK4]